jgi:hypothetical protein
LAEKAILIRQNLYADDGHFRNVSYRKSNSAGAFVTTDDISTLMLALMSPGRALVDISTAYLGSAL